MHSVRRCQREQLTALFRPPSHTWQDWFRAVIMTADPLLAGVEPGLTASSLGQAEVSALAAGTTSPVRLRWCFLYHIHFPLLKPPCTFERTGFHVRGCSEEASTRSAGPREKNHGRRLAEARPGHCGGLERTVSMVQKRLEPPQRQAQVGHCRQSAACAATRSCPALTSSQLLTLTMLALSIIHIHKPTCMLAVQNSGSLHVHLLCIGHPSARIRRAASRRNRRHTLGSAGCERNSRLHGWCPALKQTAQMRCGDRAGRRGWELIPPVRLPTCLQC